MLSECADDQPELADDTEMLADVACLALNQVPARCIRNKVDMTFYMDESERVRNEAVVRSAVEAAFRFVAGRLALGTLG